MIRILADALTNPARLVKPFGTAGMPSDQVRKLLSRVPCMAAALNGLPGERAKLVHELVEKIIVDEKTILIKLRRGLLLGGDVPSSASGEPSDSAVELTAVVAVKRRGVKTKLILPGLVQPKQSSKCDPTPIKAIARGRLWLRSSLLAARPIAPGGAGAGRGDPAGPETRRTQRGAADRTRSAARLDGAAQTARRPTALRTDVPPAAAPPQPRVICKPSERSRWDCIKVRQGERAKESRFAACTSLLTSPATRRTPSKCGLFVYSLGVHR